MHLPDLLYLHCPLTLWGPQPGPGQAPATFPYQLGLTRDLDPGLHLSLTLCNHSRPHASDFSGELEADGQDGEGGCLQGRGPEVLSSGSAAPLPERACHLVVILGTAGQHALGPELCSNTLAWAPAPRHPALPVTERQQLDHPSVGEDGISRLGFVTLSNRGHLERAFPSRSLFCGTVMVLLAA